VKITFKGKTYEDIINQMTAMLLTEARVKAPAVQGSGLEQGPAHPIAQTPVENPVPNPVDTQGKKTSKEEVAERLRAGREAKKAEREAAAALAAENKAAARNAALASARAAKAAKKAAPADLAADELSEEEGADEETIGVKGDAPPVTDPAEIARLRQKTIEDLQTAYANGHQKEVFELLSRFGNGAKSFRELPAEAFLPIREAISKGALT